MINYITQIVEIDYYLKQVKWEVYLIIFYILLFILLFVKANTIYVSYSYSKKKFSFMWPVYTLWYDSLTQGLLQPVCHGAFLPYP